MTANTTPIFELKPLPVGAQTGGPNALQFTSADTTAKKTLCTGATDGTRIDQIQCCSNDTAAINLAFYMSDGTTDFYLGNVNIPAGSGYTTVAAIDAISSLNPILGYLWVPGSATIKCACVATMTSAKALDVRAHGGVFS